MTAASSRSTPARTTPEGPRRATGRSTVGALKVSRRKSRVLPALATLAVAGALSFSTPKPAEAGPLMDMCLDLVDGWHGDCSTNAGNRFQQFACDWVAGVGYISCVIIGAGELAWPMVT